MRKNGVNRELRIIRGGVCAPEGFKAGAVSCGIRKDGEKDLGLILADGRCSVAGVYAQGPCGATVALTRKRMKDGVARAIIVNGGVANVFMKKGDRLAFDICETVGKYCLIRSEEVVIASTGEIGKTLTLDPFENGIKTLAKKVDSGEEFSYSVARAMSGEQATAQHLAFSFDIGDFPCKIGAVFKGNTRVCPNLATTLVFLTTDVNITSECLQKALIAEVKETLNLLDADGGSSPNDCVCILANGKAGNYKISCADSEYKKFTYALRGVLVEICRALASANGTRKILSCKVLGAKSKQISRILSKKLVGAEFLRRAIASGEVDIEGILYATAQVGEISDISRLRIKIKSEGKELLLFEEGVKQPINEEKMKEFLSSNEVDILLELNEGNFTSCAYGCVRA